METKKYAKYELSSDVLCIGERTKKGTFKPCISTIPFSTISGGLKNRFGLSNINAVGMFHQQYLDEIEKFKNILVYSPRSIFEDVARVPLRIEFLINVSADVFIYLNTEELSNWCNLNQEFTMNIGAFKSKGFGSCRLRFLEIIENPNVVIGELKTRITEKYLYCFGIDQIIKPVYGYLFEPINNASGNYLRALYEGSLVRGFNFLLKEVNTDGGTQKAFQ